jgi:hypothetical protein
VCDHVHTELSPQGDELSPSGSWGICAPALPEVLTLATATAADRGVLTILTEANARLAKQLEDNSNELRELKILLKKEITERRGQRSFNPSQKNYCWTHGYKVANTHTSLSCNFPKQGAQARSN